MKIQVGKLLIDPDEIREIVKRLGITTAQPLKASDIYKLTTWKPDGIQGNRNGYRKQPPPLK